MYGTIEKYKNGDKLLKGSYTLKIENNYQKKKIYNNNKYIIIINSKGDKLINIF